jgi:hypothetical protein
MKKLLIIEQTNSRTCEKGVPKVFVYKKIRKINSSGMHSAEMRMFHHHGIITGFHFMTARIGMAAGLIKLGTTSLNASLST